MIRRQGLDGGLATAVRNYAQAGVDGIIMDFPGRAIEARVRS